MPNDPIREKFEEFCKEQCSPGAHTSDWYYTIWRAAHLAGRASVIAEMRPVAWMVDTGSFQPRVTYFYQHAAESALRHLKAFPYPDATMTPLAPIPKE